MRNKIKPLILCGLFAALTAIGAFIKIPMWPAPITAQTMFIAAAGVLIGPKLGAASQLIYLLLGLFGLPIFTKGGGFGYIFQPTFGFLLASIPTVIVIGVISKKIDGVKGAVIATVCGYAVLYLIGVPYLWMIVNYVSGVEMSISAALYSGMVLFIPGDALKVAAVALLSVKLKPVVRFTQVNSR
ncbi:MAG: biotin transporter BioY [Oscillospiraceae bacterium]|nr:biotin transporter BioY [Oscillospiraceae bacterium]